MRIQRSPILVVLLAAVGRSVAVCMGGEERSAVSSVRADTEWLAGVSSRLVGSSEHATVRQQLLEKIRSVPGVRVWTHEFPIMVPEVDEADLTVGEGEWAGKHRVYPLWPAGVRLNTTPAEGIEGEIVYVGEGNLDRLPVKRVRGQIAAMEMTGGAQWRVLFGLGARAVLLLGSGKERFAHAETHLLPISVNFPRFYVPQGKLADALRRKEVRRARLISRAQWREKCATNIYALIRSERAMPQKALAVAVAFDAMSVVPERAPGADAAVDSAVALALLRRLASHGSERPVLFAFLDACGIGQRGAREMLSAFGATPDLRSDLREDSESLLNEYREDEQRAAALESEPDPLSRVWAPTYRPLHKYVKQEMQKEILTVEARLEPLRLKRHSTDQENRETLDVEIGDLKKRRDGLYNAFNRLVSDAPLEAGARERAGILWKNARNRIRNQLVELEKEAALDARREQLRQELLAALGLRETSSLFQLPIAFMLGLDLSDAGTAVGPSRFDGFLNVDETLNSADLCRWLQALSNNPGSAWPKHLQYALNLAPVKGLDPDALKVGGHVGRSASDTPRPVDLSPLTGLESASSYMVGVSPNITAPAPSFGVPAMTWATLDGTRTRVDTPLDRAEYLDWDRLGPQVDATMLLVEALANDRNFAKVEKARTPNVLRVRGLIVDQAPGEPVARIPMSGCLATLTPGWDGLIYRTPVVAGVRPMEFIRTGADGGFAFDYVAGTTGLMYQRWMLQSFLLDTEGRIVRAVNQRKKDKGVRLNLDRQARKAPLLRAEMFTCRELAVSGLFDPRFLMPLPQATVLDASRGGPPRRVNTSLYEGMMSCFLEHDTRWQLLLRAGIISNRMILVNLPLLGTDDQRSLREVMRGFNEPDDLPGYPLHVAAQDFYNVDSKRLTDYRKEGITSRPVEQLQEKTRASLESARTAYASDDGAGFFRHAMAALSNEVRVYQAVKDISSDVIRGAIALLLLLVPFAYVTERLLLGSAHVYKQIGGVFGILIVMSGILWSFHPAFRISGMPLMIVMAFAIIFMSLLVISKIFSKFETELETIRSGTAESSGAKTSRYGLLMTAIRLGIANMRKRKLRTALTGLTVMLITFALLCFMSTTAYTGQQELALDHTSASPAVLIRQPSERPLPVQALPMLQNLVGDSYPVLPQYGWSNPWEMQWRLHVRDPASGRQIALSAALGLSGGEGRVSGIDRICPRWEEFRATGGCDLAETAAQELGVQPGDEVVVAGHTLKLVGVYDASLFDREIRRLDGRPLTPLDYSTVDDQQRRSMLRSDLQTLAVEMESGGGAAAEQNVQALSSAQVVILPADLLNGMARYELCSLAIPVGSADEGRALAMRLSEVIAFPVYYGSSEGVHVITSAPLSAKAPKSMLIPLLIAGFIILNTMLSSLAERRREIYVYTSLGLAPLHIGMLFLAEAVTYGLLGSISGYVIGQGLAKVFSELGWMGGLTLNFGGTQAISTIALVLGVVVVSSLVPAYLAGKVAAPSNQMRWRVPMPEREAGTQIIRDQLPFTATSKTAAGIAAFLYEYLEAHRDGVIGHFTTGDLRASRRRINGQERLTLDATVWLAPYDLGIRQDVAIHLTETGEAEDIYGIGIELRHGSGQTENWHRLNRTFLADLRSQLLGWRKLTTERIMACIDRGENLLRKGAEERT